MNEKHLPLWLLEEFLKDHFPDTSAMTRKIILSMVEQDRVEADNDRNMNDIFRRFDETSH